MRSKLRINIIKNVGIKVLALLVSMASMPTMMSFFSNDVVLGVWFTILSILNWISFFDFGIGNGLRNDLTYALAARDEKKAKTVISSSVFLLSIVVVLLMPASIGVSFAIDWSAIFSVEDNLVTRRELSSCMSIVIGGTLLQLILKLVNSLLYSMRHDAMPAFLLLVSNVLIFLAIAFPPSLNDLSEKLFYMAVVEVVFLSIPLIVAGIALFAGPLKKYIPSVGDVDKGYFKTVGSLGIKFFVIQLALLFVSSSNELFIGMICGSESVVPYSVAYRVFNLILVFFGVVAQPVWTDMAASFALKDMSRLLSVHRKYLLLAMLVSIVTFIIGLTINPILRVWLSGQAPSLSVIDSLSLSLLVTATVVTNAETCLGNATNKLWPQVFCFVFAAIAKFPLSLALSGFGLGWAAVVMSNALVLVPAAVVQHFSNRWLSLTVKHEKVKK